jgi:hypothetical protein
MMDLSTGYLCESISLQFIRGDNDVDDDDKNSNEEEECVRVALKTALSSLASSNSSSDLVIFYLHDRLDFDEVHAILNSSGKKGGLVVPVIGLADENTFALLRNQIFYSK